MTLNRLYKILGRLIENGHGRCRVSVAKESFQDNREDDGCTILPIAGVDVKWIGDADDDGGSAINKDGTERGRTTIIIGGSSFTKKDCIPFEPKPDHPRWLERKKATHED